MYVICYISIVHSTNYSILLLTLPVHTRLLNLAVCTDYSLSLHKITQSRCAQITQSFYSILLHKITQSRCAHKLLNLSRSTSLLTLPLFLLASLFSLLSSFFWLSSTGLSSNCNVNESSYTNLGHSFSMTGYAYNTEQAKAFLAGSYQFKVSEVEVFKIAQ